MDNSLSWIIEIIDKEVAEKLSSALRSVSVSFKEEIIMQRMRMIKQWFEGFDGSRWWSKEQQIVNSSWHVDGINGFISFESFTTTYGVGNFDSAEAWKERNEVDGEPSQDYVSKLIWERGIIGLPLASSMPNSDWVNEHFHIKEPLEFFMISNHGWDSLTEKLEQTILEKIN